MRRTFVMLLTKRSGDIIRVLIRFPQDKPITTAMNFISAAVPSRGNSPLWKNGSPLRVSVLSVSAV